MRYHEFAKAEHTFDTEFDRAATAKDRAACEAADRKYRESEEAFRYAVPDTAGEAARRLDYVWEIVRPQDWCEPEPLAPGQEEPASVELDKQFREALTAEEAQRRQMFNEPAMLRESVDPEPLVEAADAIRREVDDLALTDPASVPQGLLSRIKSLEELDPETGEVPVAGRGQGRDRKLAPALQRSAPAFQPRLPDAGRVRGEDQGVRRSARRATTPQGAIESSNRGGRLKLSVVRRNRAGQPQGASELHVRRFGVILNQLRGSTWGIPV